MLTEKNELLPLVEGFIEKGCDNKFLQEKGVRCLKSYLRMNDFNCFTIYDLDYSIKCVFDKGFLKKYLAHLPSYINLDNLEGM
jgi:hypothetical protein